MPVLNMLSTLLDDFAGTGTTPGSGHLGWQEVEGSVHTAVATTDGGTPSITIQWSLDGVTIADTDVLTPTSGTPATVTRTPEVWRYARANVTANAGLNTLNLKIASI